MKVAFKDMFKPGDIICSDRFHNGKCMIVKEFLDDSYIPGRRYYRCEDMVLDGQLWGAHERDSFSDRSNNWRLATDDDIVNYLARFVKIKLGEVGNYEVYYADDGINVEGFADFFLHLDTKELAQLSNIINERLEDVK